MAVILSRDHAITVPLLSTYGTASLLSKDGEEVKVPLALLLGASTMVRSIVAESHLHPGVHGPLVLSFTVAGDVLARVGELLGVGESNVKEKNIDEVAQVLDLLGVAANLSQCRKNIEYDHIATNDEDITTNEKDIATNEKDIATNKEDIATYEEETVTSVEDIAINEDHIKLEIVFEPISEVETCLREDDFDKATDNSLKEKNVDIEKIVERPDERYRPNKKVATKTVNICNVCEYSAKFASQLEVHMRRHTGEKPFKCTICTFSSYNAYGLKRHIRIHTGEKPYTCRICDSSYSQSSQLRTHSRVHSGEKPFKCKICPYSSSYPNNLKLHNRIHTGEKPYTCQICNKSFSKSLYLRNHGKIHTREKNHCV